MNKKRILLVTQNFYPENFKSNDIAFELVKRGYQVDALVSIPNYPKGKFFDGYGVFKRRIETVNGVRIYRALQIPRGKGGGVMLVLNYLSFAFFASFWAIGLGLFKKYDSIIVHETSPITQIWPAIIIKAIRRIPLYLWVLDLWPESLIAAGNINSKLILKPVEVFVKFAYNCSTKILISSACYSKSILEKGNYEDKLIYFPNWAEDAFIEKNNFKLPQLPEGFRVMWAGNVGEAQDFESIMKSILLLKNHCEIKWIIVGEGRKKEWVEKFIMTNSLQDVVYMMGRYELEAMPAFFAAADVMLVSLKNNPIFNLTVPAKIQAYMSAGKPIAAMISGEANDLIKLSECGYATNSGDSDGLANIIRTMYTLPKSELDQLGINGNIYYKRYFSKQKCLDNLCSIIDK